MDNPKYSIVLPCRNEETTIEICIKKIKTSMKNLDYEIIVSDSSKDKSPEIAKKLGARVIKHNRYGYGIACILGINASKGGYIIMADADNSYDFLELPGFIKELEKGYDLILSSRYKGEIKKGSMPWLHRYIGNPFLSFTLNKKFKTNFSDTHSGFRAFTKEAFSRMDLKCNGMEFASEMLIKAKKNSLKIKEIPITYWPRKGISKMRSFRDGFRHLLYILRQ